MYSPVRTMDTAMFNIQQFYVLPTQCFDVFCMDLRTNGKNFCTFNKANPEPEDGSRRSM
jgi:hypothetical protein